MEITPPPVMVEQRKPRNYWTWALFLALAGVVVYSVIYSYFGDDSTPKKAIDAPLMAAPIAMKQYATFLKLGDQLGSDQLDSVAATNLEQTRNQFEPLIGESDEAAEWVLAIDTVLGNELDAKALDRLQLSEDATSVDMGDAFAGEISRAIAVDDVDIPGQVAAWRLKNPGAEEFPIEVLGLAGNPFLFLGLIGWMILVFLVGIVVLFFYGGLKLAGQLPAKGYQANISLEETDAFGGRMAIYFATFLVLSLGVGVLAVPELGLGIPGPYLQAGMFVILIGLIPVFTTVPLFGFKKRFREIIGDTSGMFGKLGWGLAGYAANFPVALLTIGIMSRLLPDLPTPSHGAIEELLVSGPVAMGLLYFMIAIGAPLVEEPMFRGVLFPAFQRIFRSPTTAIILQGVIFAVIHPQGPLLWPALACIGITGAILTRQTGSIIPAIVMHFMHNSTLYALNVVIR